MTVVVTRNVPDRFRGFLASCMLELAPGTYTAPRMNAAVRDRVWSVLSEWWTVLKEGSVVMTWSDSSASGGQAVATLGTPARSLVELDGVVLSHRHLSATELQTLFENATTSGSSS